MIHMNKYIWKYMCVYMYVSCIYSHMYIYNKETKNTEPVKYNVTIIF